MRKRVVMIILSALFLAGCASLSRGCSSWQAESFGSDWIIVQYGMDGRPINCWKEVDASVTNETNSDGIYWKDSETGHLIHISGWYNRVQVSGGDFEQAAKLVGVNLQYITNGRYIDPTWK